MAEPRAAAREVALRIGLWLLLGGWLGAWACFGLLVAPTAFRVLPTTEIAGQLVGPVLGRLNAYGAGAGILLGLLGWRLRRGPTLVILPLLAAALCLYSELGITPQIAALRPLAFGPEGSPESAARFRELHQLSVGIFLLVAAAVVVLVAAHAARDAPRGGGDPP